MNAYFRECVFEKKKEERNERGRHHAGIKVKSN